MGVPKQKWTSEEETALRAGVTKHGPGKWSTILKDPEFVSVLRLRSNVDLKDKWRNLHSVGCGSRQRSRPTKSKTQLTHTPESISIVSTGEHDMQICLTDHPTPVSVTLQNDSGKLIEVNHRYKIVMKSDSGVKKNQSPLLPEVKQECCPPTTTKILTKADIDAELEKMRSMSPQQAAAMAVKAVAEAEAAIAEAERAVSEAEAAEADAKLAKVYAAAAAMRAPKQTTLCT